MRALWFLKYSSVPPALCNDGVNHYSACVRCGFRNIPFRPRAVDVIINPITCTARGDCGILRWHIPETAA